jgi:hypothetical protein
MTRLRSARRAALAAMLGTATTAAVLFACTFTQSLEYLQKGGGADVVSDDPNDVGDGGVRTPTVLVANQTKPGFLAQDATALYWLGGGTVFSVPKAGGMPKKLGSVAGPITSLVADPNPDGAVFVAIGKDVARFPKDGSDGGVVFAGAAADPLADTVAANETSLYVLQYDQNGEETHRILRMTKDGAGQVDIAPDSGPATLTLDSTSVFWLTIGIDNPSFVEQPKAAAPGAGTTVYKLAADDDLPLSSSQVAVDQGAIYWIAEDFVSGGVTIFSRKRAPSAPTVALFRGTADDAFTNIAVDDAYAYVLDTKKSTLLRVPKTGGPAETVVAGLNAPSGLVIDATAIYITVEAIGDTGQVLTVAK